MKYGFNEKDLKKIIKDALGEGPSIEPYGEGLLRYQDENMTIVMGSRATEGFDQAMKEEVKKISQEKNSKL
ncbi:hypothetical protein PP178_04255 [Zeaxanthinibacter sp. PT1]|uniref:hypothetical protein n=1 Tax=Zeaxanthinibacter TaxID=561554 RepID=UPI002349B5AE|nr:hypothetical protein [Zeaxanthinibacter sp. PT1]MDC6350752.1 hypothetical protein [Zeaxanthinibacter sp. PT1]